MNILILTPDRVGSTLLQRLITVYANINECSDPLTINLSALPYTPSDLTQAAQLEHSKWVSDSGNLLTNQDIPAEQLLLADLKFPTTQ